ncbi:MAG: DinB family protein [Marinoscillum sp.]
MTLREIIEQFNEVYEGEPWFGNSISTYLQEISPEMVSTRMNSGHSIGQIIAHMIVWRNYTIEKLKGEDLKIKLGSDEDWANQEFNAENKTELYSQFKSTQKTLNQLLNAQNDSLLNEQVPGEKFNFHTLLVGLVQHDIYHLGQIYLLKSSR